MELFKEQLNASVKTDTHTYNSSIMKKRDVEK